MCKQKKMDTTKTEADTPSRCAENYMNITIRNLLNQTRYLRIDGDNLKVYHISLKSGRLPLFDEYVNASEGLSIIKGGVVARIESLTAIYWNHLCSRLQQIASGWERYKKNMDTSDGIQWRVTLQINGETSEYSGGNSYPDNWEELISLMNDLTGEKPVYFRSFRFFPAKNPDYEKHFPVKGKTEMVSHDGYICKMVEVSYDEKFQYMNHYWNSEVTNWRVLLEKPLAPDEQIVAYFVNPVVDSKDHRLDEGFVFCGYDISNGGTSSITNCGYNGLGEAFEKAIPYDQLNQFGLISDYISALEINSRLKKEYPDEPHANGTSIYELWRMV